MRTYDITEIVRRGLQQALNAEEAERKALEDKYGQVWDSDQIRQDFDVLSFAAPLMIVTRKSDGKRGSLFFQHSPRFYWGFEEA